MVNLKKSYHRQILFGTAGPPSSSQKRSTESGVRRAKELGLECMEVEFVKGVKMGDKTACVVRKTAEECGIELSCHAPYYINLASPDRKKREDSMKRLLDAARAGALCGARNIVFHAGFYMKREPGEVYAMIRRNIEKVLESLRENGIKDVVLRPEVTGKPSVFGSLDEIIRLSADIEGVLPCIDFSHLFTRSLGRCNTYKCYAGVLEQIGGTLGEDALEDMHIHLSGIEYGPAGERRHLPAAESKIRYREVLKALADFGAAGLLICESPDESKEKNALMFRKYYGKRIRPKR